MTINEIIQLLGPSGAIVAGIGGITLSLKLFAYSMRMMGWWIHRKDLQQGKPSNPPPELPQSLTLLLVLLVGSMMVMAKPITKYAHMVPRMPEESAANGKRETKPIKSKEEPTKKNCGSGCTGTPPNCRCTTTTETTTKLSGVSTSILGTTQAWEMEPITIGLPTWKENFNDR